MTEVTQTHLQESSRHRDGHSHPKSKKHLQTALLILVAVLLPLVAGFLHAGFMVPVLGSLGILLLAVSNIFRIQAGIFPSLVCLLLMIMLNIWHWADTYFIALYTGNILTGNLLFRTSATEAIAVLVALWAYLRLMKKLNMRITQEWFVRKSLVKFISGIFFLQLFLLFFWTSGYLLDLCIPDHRLDTYLFTLIAVLAALLLSGFLFAGYLLLEKKDTGRKHRPHHH